MKTQNQKIKDYLQKGKSITAIEALNKFQCFRLSARICDLKKEGLVIKRTVIPLKKGSYIASYSLN